MTQHITQEQAVELARGVPMNFWVAVEITALCNAAIQHYIEQQIKSLPVLPEPSLYAHELLPNKGGIWLGVVEKGICEQAHVEGETGTEVREYYTADQLQAYGQQCREQALEEAKQLSDVRAKAWWSTHCETNKHMDTTRKAHDDFCALSVAIESLKAGK